MAAKRKREQRAKCLKCKTNKAQSRGRCWGCLRDAHTLIEIGETTEEKLIAEGTLLKARKPGRKAAVSRKRLVKAS